MPTTTHRCWPARRASVHVTSAGVVEYLRCRCGRLLVRQAGRDLVRGRP